MCVYRKYLIYTGFDTGILCVCVYLVILSHDFKHNGVIIWGNEKNACVTKL